jgi:hypothetical protein
MYFNWNYQNLPGKMCRIEKNPIMISPYPILTVEKNDVEAYIYWVFGEIIVVHHQKFQDLNINKTRQALTPIALIGPVDQHSFLQLIIDGVPPTFSANSKTLISRSCANLVSPLLALEITVQLSLTKTYRSDWYRWFKFGC